MRRPLPDHPQEEIVHSPGDICPAGRYALLEAWRGCDGYDGEESGSARGHPSYTAEALPTMLRDDHSGTVARPANRESRPGPGLIANVVVGKYLDGLPLYRQSVILTPDDIQIERATLATGSGMPPDGALHWRNCSTPM